MPFISWKLVESRSKDSNACLSLFLLAPISLSINLCRERYIYIYMPRRKKDAVIHARISSSSFWFDVAAVFVARVAVRTAR